MPSFPLVLLLCPNQDKKTLLSSLIRFQTVGYLPPPRSSAWPICSDGPFSSSSSLASSYPNLVCVHVAQLLPCFISAPTSPLTGGGWQDKQKDIVRGRDTQGHHHQQWQWEHKRRAPTLVPLLCQLAHIGHCRKKGTTRMEMSHKHTAGWRINCVA